MQKVAILTPGFKPVPAVEGGAIEQLIEYIILGNEKHYKYDIDLYTIDSPYFSKYHYKHTKIIKLSPRPNKYWRFFFGITNEFTNFFKCKKIINYISYEMSYKYKTNYYDAVLIENNMDVYSMILPKITKEKIYFHLHNNFNCDDPDKTLKKTKLIINSADKIIVVSSFLKRKLNAIGARNVEVVPNAVIAKNFNQLTETEKIALRDKLGISKADFVFTFVGRVSKEKGIDKLLSALLKLKNYDNVKCLIIGDNFFGTSEESKYLIQLEKMANRIKDKIVFTGYVQNNELYKFYSISDCVVIPSQWEEVFGVVALEAMTMKLPVIASLSGGLPDVLFKSKALLIKRDNKFVTTLVKDMKNVMDNSSLREEMKCCSFQRSKDFPSNEIEYFDIISRIMLNNKR